MLLVTPKLKQNCKNDAHFQTSFPNTPIFADSLDRNWFFPLAFGLQQTIICDQQKCMILTRFAHVLSIDT